jgi:hypothetical protein
MGSIPSVYSTGINDFYNPLNTGSLDFHYSLSPPGTPIGSNDFTVVTDTTGTGWIQPWDNARWLSVAQDPTTTLSSVTYYTAFNLDRFDASTATITGEWAASGAGSVYLNGLATPITTTGSRSAFSLSGPFTRGINYLSFNVASNNNQNGLLVSMTGTANPIPEPSAFLTMAIGLFAAALGLKMRRKLNNERN